MNCAWEANQPWGQETSLRRGETSGPCQVAGAVRVCAPSLMTPKFSPAGPSATVPVLGCSFPEESYPSLANQPSSGAKQGDVRFSSVSLVAYAPVASTPSACLGIPSSAGEAQVPSPIQSKIGSKEGWIMQYKYVNYKKFMLQSCEGPF